MDDVANAPFISHLIELDGRRAAGF